MALRIVHTARCIEHEPPPGHPERPERATAMTAVVERWRSAGTAVIEPRPATRDELRRVHAPAYLERLASLAGAPAMLDPDTYTSVASHDLALLAAGACCQAVELALADKAPVAAVVRPPGHHAEADRAMGFCLLNNAAVAAAHARALGCDRVAVVDFDVHHGNGTQWIFYDNPSVLYVSTHQFPYYPGTGAADETGIRDGAGFTVNVPLAAGAGDADYDLVFRRAVVPVLEQFDPDLLMVSAGFDLHARDPLGGMRVTTAGIAGLVRHLRRAAACTPAGGRIVVVTEGGYDIDALASSLDATLRVLDEPPAAPAAPDGDSSRGATALAAVRSSMAGRWPTL